MQKWEFNAAPGNALFIRTKVMKIPITGGVGGGTGGAKGAGGGGWEKKSCAENLGAAPRHTAPHESRAGDFFSARKK